MAEAAKAVEAIKRSWAHWSGHRREHFHPGVPEPKLTRVIRKHASTVTGRELGLLGYWGAEPVENEIDQESGQITEETRSDILYAWNDDERSMHLVFEFKKINHTDSSRKYYLGNNGVLRFVTGRYSRQQAVAVMVGILNSPGDAIESGLRRSLQTPGQIAALKMLRGADGVLHSPSLLFPDFASFDTEHQRTPDLAPSHGTIRISHAFVGFPYTPSKGSPKRSRKITLERLD